MTCHDAMQDVHDRLADLIEAVKELCVAAEYDAEDAEFELLSASREPGQSECATASMSPWQPLASLQSAPITFAPIQSTTPMLPLSAIELSDGMSGIPSTTTTPSLEAKSAGSPSRPLQPMESPPSSVPVHSIPRPQLSPQSMRSLRTPDSNGEPSRTSRMGTGLGLLQLLTLRKNGST